MLIRYYLAALAAFVLLLVVACRWQEGSETVEPAGRLAAGHLLKQAATFAARLSPEAAGLRLTLGALTTYTRDGAVRPACTVYGIDPAGVTRFFCVFDTDTGDLIRLSHVAPTQVVEGYRIRSASEAVQTARTWLESMETAKQRPSWRLDGAAKPAGGTWYVHGQSGSSRALVGLDTDTGNLKLLSRHLQP